jgi:cell division septation protein DedD
MASGNIKNFELKLGRTGLVIVILGVAALLCCAFLFGVTIGKNIDTYPEKIASLPQRILAFIWRPAKIKVEQPTIEKKGAQNQSKSQEELDLTFYNTLTSKKGVAKEQPLPDKKPAIEAPSIRQLEPQQKTEVKSAVISPSMDAKRQQTVPGETGIDEIETKIREAEPQIAANGGNFSVQVASLKEKTKAHQMNKKILALGFTPRIMETNVPGKGTWFRVVVYGFSSKALAQTAAEKISNKTGTNCIVRRMDVAAKNN